ncbi:hypothetical protein pipiens_003564 [Culex pipiens pipiens]|uniref:Methyltransferase type 12 domain-containing protein n=1 Tax=Culex pipiens pipiens TaxID=38569 RepID=A0ABD1CVZ1_CULPP
MSHPEFLSKWKNHRNIRLLDVGCGDGEALVRFLLPLVPGYSSAVAIDMLEEMIRSCSARYGSVPRLTWRQLDVTTSDLTALESLGKFSHVASTFCFHWIVDQRQLFGNVHKLMLPGGQLFATLLRDTDLSYAVEELARMDKWAPFMANWRSYPSVYARNDQWESLLRGHMESAGFNQIDITITSSTFDFKEDCDMKGKMA